VETDTARIRTSCRNFEKLAAAALVGVGVVAVAVVIVAVAVAVAVLLGMSRRDMM
jgi:hypothetical protein